MAATGFFMSIAPVLAKTRPALRNIFDLGHMASGSCWLGARPAEAKKQTPALVRLHQPQLQLARGGKMARDEILDGGRQFSALTLLMNMPYYYAYHVDDAGHFVSRLNIHADGDETAVEKARQRLGGRDIEVWCLDRKVARLKRTD
jgi:hypothetical protein